MYYDNNEDIKFDESSNDIQRLIHSNGIYDKYRMKFTSRFTRIPIIDPYNVLTNTKEYIFATKPDLWIFNPGDIMSLNPSLEKNSFFVDAVDRYRSIAAQLQGSLNVGGTPFMPIISNCVTSSLDVPGLDSDLIETGKNIMGTSIKYRSTSVRSDEDHSFNLEFEDTKYLDVYMLFKMYDEYEKLKWEGGIDFTANGCDRWQNYIINKVLHDQFTFYKFVVAEDGMRIVYYASITGCTISNVPRDAFSDMSNNKDGQKLTVGFKGHFVRDMDPIIIRQFNSIAHQTSGFTLFNDMSLYDTNDFAINGDWALSPYVATEVVCDQKHGVHREYYLKWRG